MSKDAPLGASVVIPTRDRPTDLMRVLSSLRNQQTPRTFEVIVVDDGSVPPLDPALLAGLDNARMVRGEGRGPAVARNAGIAAATSDTILLTDDDTEPAPGWIEAACAFLDGNRKSVGVEGPVSSPAYDPLYEHSLENNRPGAYWTCNIAYRRSTLATLDGFHEEFPTPHCEDLDLAYRALALGPIGFSEQMAIVHHPRSLTLRKLIDRGRMAASEAVLFERHRERFGRARSLPPALFPITSAIYGWKARLEAERGSLRSPRRLARFVVAAAGHLAVVTATTFRAALRSPRADTR
jgi:glycosyltransferase involved in cell wall biosynthesis